MTPDQILSAIDISLSDVETIIDRLERAGTPGPEIAQKFRLLYIRASGRSPFTHTVDIPTMTRRKLRQP